MTTGTGTVTVAWPQVKGCWQTSDTGGSQDASPQQLVASRRRENLQLLRLQYSDTHEDVQLWGQLGELLP